MIDGDFVAEYGDGDIEQGCGAMLGQKGFLLIVSWIGSLTLNRVIKVGRGQTKA